MAKVIFVGTGSGKTSLTRDHSSLLISTDNFNLLIDPGDGISKSLIKRGIDHNCIDGILFTHFHPDHFCGFPSLLAQMKISKRREQLTVFAHESKISFLNHFLENSYLFSARMGYPIVYKTFDDISRFIVHKNFSFAAGQNSHLDKYSEHAPDSGVSLSTFSFLFSVEGKKVFYTGDVGDKSDLYLFKNEKIDVLISEISHISLTDIIEASEQAKVKSIYLTHISDEDEPNIDLIFNSCSAEEKDKINIAKDGTIINLE